MALVDALTSREIPKSPGVTVSTCCRNQAYGDITLSHTEVGDFTDAHDLTGRIDLGCDDC